MRILVVEDDEVLREAVADILQEEGYEVTCAEAGDEGLFAARQGIHDLLVLDIMLPEISGLEIVRTLRSEGCTVPILLLTARDSIDDRVQGLEAGADDYMVKPFAMRELLARLKALLRRKGNLMPEDRLTYGGIVLNSARRDACIGETCLGLGSKEYDILEFLLLNSEQILTREQVFDRIWGMNCDTGIGIVDIYIHHLRKKLAPYGQDRLVQTIRGVGFMLKEP